MVQWMGACLPTQGDTGLIPGLGRSCRSQSNQDCGPQQEKTPFAATGESPHKATKTQAGKKRNCYKKTNTRLSEPPRPPLWPEPKHLRVTGTDQGGEGPALPHALQGLQRGSSSSDA